MADRTPKYTHPPEVRGLMETYQSAWNAAYASGATGSDTAHIAGLRAVQQATPPPVHAVTREELAEIIRPWVEAAMDSAIPEPWEVAANCANGAADAILSRLAAGQPSETK
jgi:hypothetical protein